MKKFLIATVVAVFAAVAFTALSVAAPWSGSARAKADTANRLPALPPDVRQRGRWKIGVKCDFPPFGYINRQNRIAGYDVDVARRFAELAFGRRNRVSLTCVTTPSRIPALQRGDVDIIISTLTWTVGTRGDHRLLLPVLQRDRQAPRAEQLPARRRPPDRSSRPEDRDDARLDLRPLRRQLLPDGHQGPDGLAGDGAREPPFRAGGRVHVRRHLPARSGGERHEPPHDHAQVPERPVRDRDQEGRHRDEAVGERSRAADEAEGRVLADPPPQLSAAVLAVLPRPTSRGRRRRRPIRGAGCPRASARAERTAESGWPPRAAATPLVFRWTSSQPSTGSTSGITARSSGKA